MPTALENLNAAVSRAVARVKNLQDQTHAGHALVACAIFDQRLKEALIKKWYLYQTRKSRHCLKDMGP